MKTQNLQLFYFNTPKRAFYKKVKNTQEALAIFMQDCAKITMQSIAKNNYSFKQVDCARFN
jgi:hypothetical protein